MGMVNTKASTAHLQNREEPGKEAEEVGCETTEVRATKGLTRQPFRPCEMGQGRAQGREMPQNACPLPEETMGGGARHADKC